MKRPFEDSDAGLARQLEKKLPPLTTLQREPFSPYPLFGHTHNSSMSEKSELHAPWTDKGYPSSYRGHASRFTFSDAESIPLKPLSKSMDRTHRLAESHCYVRDKTALPVAATPPSSHATVSASDIRKEKINNPFLEPGPETWFEAPMKSNRPMLGGDLYPLSKDTWIVSPLRPGSKPFLARIEAHDAMSSRVTVPIRRRFSALHKETGEAERDAKEFLEYSRLAYYHATRDSARHDMPRPVSSSSDAFLEKDDTKHREKHKFLEASFVESIKKKIQAALNFTVQETVPDYYQKLREQESHIDKELDERIEKLKLPTFERFPSLPDEQVAKLNRLLSSASSDTVVYEAFNISLTVKDLESLQPRQWLNDEVINFYFQLLKARSLSLPGCPKLHVLNSFFYTTLSDHGYARVKRWTKNVDIFDFDMILFPIHLGMHWVLGHVDMKHHRLCYYDSLHGSPRRYFSLMKQYLLAESMDKRQLPLDLSDWLEVAPKSIPGQQNGFDCGMFTCQYAECLGRGGAFDFNQSHMPYFRKRLQIELCQGKFLS